ncbi:MAG: phosphatidate cytidylyltransferase [Hydrogenovibrio sp.]
MLMQRVITATLLFAGVLALLFSENDQAWFVFVLLSTLICAWEWAGLAAIKRPWQRWMYALLVVALSAWLALSASVHVSEWMTLTVTVIMVAAVLVYQATAGAYSVRSQLGILSLGGLVLANFAVLLVAFLEHYSPLILLLSLFVIWAIDTGAYFSGRRFGRRKLAPHVSPGKTWEGVLGGGLLAFVVAWLGLIWLAPSLSISYALAALCFAAVALVSVFGDLFESLLKRQAGLKDSSRILPGHGGLLDRADSLLIAVPMFFFVWTWIRL